MVDLTSVIINQALKDEKNLEVAYETWRAFSSQRIYNQIRENFVAKLIEQISIELKNKYTFFQNKIDWTDKSNSYQINLHLIAQGSDWTNKYKFGLYDYDGDRLFFSIACLNDDKEFCKKAHTQIKYLLKEGNDYPNHWWSRVKEPYNRWESNYEGFRQFAFCDKIALDYLTTKFCSHIELIDKEMNKFA